MGFTSVCCLPVVLSHSSLPLPLFPLISFPIPSIRASGPGRRLAHLHRLTVFSQIYPPPIFKALFESDVQDKSCTRHERRPSSSSSLLLQASSFARCATDLTDVSFSDHMISFEALFWPSSHLMSLSLSLSLSLSSSSIAPSFFRSVVVLVESFVCTKLQEGGKCT